MSVNCTVWSVKCRMWREEYKVWSVKYKIWNILLCYVNFQNESILKRKNMFI